MPNSRFKTYVKKLLHVLYLAIFASYFLLQQLFAYSNPFFGGGYDPGFSSGIATSHSRIFKSSASLHRQAHLFYIDIELEPSGDDDTRPDASEFSGSQAREFAVQELDFSCELRIRLLHMATMALSHGKIPFFILHHSWKAHLA